MRTPEAFNLPTAKGDYSAPDEQTMRRSIEQYLQDLRGDVISVRDKKDRASSKAIRKYQFLLMGAPNG